METTTAATILTSTERAKVIARILNTKGVKRSDGNPWRGYPDCAFVWSWSAATYREIAASMIVTFGTVSR